MANDVMFEGKERRMAKIEKCLAEYGIASLEEARDLCLSKGIDVDKIVKGVQPIAFENAVLGLHPGLRHCAEEGRYLRCRGCRGHRHRPAGFLRARLRCRAAQRRPGPRQPGRHAAARRDQVLLRSWPATSPLPPPKAPSALPAPPTSARKEPLRIILNGLGKDAAYIISRINGFTYVKTDYDFYNGELKIVEERAFSDGERAAVKCYGANDVLEGVAIMKHEGVDVSITGNSTNPTRFQHLVAGTYKKWALENGKKYFSVASGGGTGRTLHPDNMAAGPASYGLTDSMGRMHGDAQFAGSSSVPAHVEMMGLIGMGNNPMVGATVACAVAVYEASK